MAANKATEKLAKTTLWLCFVALGFVFGFIFRTYSESLTMPRVHKLQSPLLVTATNTDGTADRHDYLLPAGTSLYYDQAFPEGFVRYMVYVNVEGVLLESKETNEKFWLDPLTAYPVSKDDLKKLLDSYPLTKSELASVLKSGSISKQEIRDLLEEYSK